MFLFINVKIEIVLTAQRIIRHKNSIKIIQRSDKRKEERFRIFYGKKKISKLKSYEVRKRKKEKKTRKKRKYKENEMVVKGRPGDKIKG